MSASVVPEGIGNGIKSKTKTLVRNSESYKELSTGTPTSERPSSGNQDHRMAILNFSKNDLLQLLGLLEAELEARELVISSLKSERSNILQPSSNHHKQYTLHNPYAALSRDKDDKGTQEDGKKTSEADPVIILQTMVDRHKKVEEQMKQQLDDLSKNHQQVLKELALERQKHAQETAHGDDVTYLLEKDRERLSQQVDFEKAQQKKMERETKRAQSVLIEERKKHMSVVKALLDEHRYLQNELAEALQRLEQADCEAHACKVDARKAMAMLAEERQKAEKREAEIERQISEFDIEREQLVGKLKREENRTKKLQETLDEANGRVSELEHVLELSRELSQKDSSSDIVTRTKSTELKGTEDNNSSLGPISYRPKSSTFPSSTSGQVNLTRSSKLFAPRGFKSPLRTSESSSGSSEELSSPNTQKINVRTKNRSSGDFAAKKGSNDSLERSSGDETVIDVHSTSVTIKPKVASITPSRRTAEAARKGLSPANSVDKLATKERSSTPTDLTKISKIPAMTKKVVTVGVVSPQQSRKVAELEVATTIKTPEVNHSQDSADSTSKPLPRPNNFTKSTTVDTSAEVISKQKDALSPTSPPGRPILPYTTFSGVNVKAKAAQLISPSAKKNIMAGSSSSAAGMKGAAPLPPPTPVGNSKLASQVNGTVSTGDLGITNTSPPGLHGTKRASPRGTPPPVPNKPTLIPQKLASSTTTTTSSPLSTSVTSSPSLSSQGTKSSTTPPPPPPLPIVNKRPDSLVEARKLFYANKHGSVTCDNPNSVHVRSTTHNINSNNSNNYRSSSDVFDIDVPPSLDRFPAAPVPVKGILG